MRGPPKIEFDHKGECISANNDALRGRRDLLHRLRFGFRLVEGWRGEPDRSKSFLGACWRTRISNHAFWSVQSTRYLSTSNVSGTRVSYSVSIPGVPHCPRKDHWSGKSIGGSDTEGAKIKSFAMYFFAIRVSLPGSYNFSACSPSRSWKRRTAEL